MNREWFRKERQTRLIKRTCGQEKGRGERREKSKKKESILKIILK